MTSDADQKPALTSETSAHWTAKGFSNPYLLLSLTCLFWSGNHIVGRAMGGHVPPMAISTLRWMIPAIVLFVIGHRQIRKDWPVIRKHWKIVLWLSMTGGTIFTALQYVGLEYTSALNVSVMNSLVPVLIVPRVGSEAQAPSLVTTNIWMPLGLPETRLRTTSCVEA